ncbi:hypothetical protein Palpr_2292 [Paludibacter propionicigenes WB4]|uniref:Fibronectin type-III domain-containing protein n=1 Tax=Paludibacter propionicigenes (strain DSM 17365 / JCM 13257 / WB4) TaxID=694427 RepID=E4T6T4_PALPW|nr:fibronectin type III domain-containing protein [Paludibacter propionicigenes]ADQ80428.1 hypothetical protein Palpr_2292 [Paludibacter propionicigenes WB4]
MGNAKVSINFSSGKYSDEALGTKTNNIIENMERNPNFQSPTPSIQELRTANNNYIASLAKVEGGTKQDTVIKNNLRAIVEDMLQTLGGYVQTISGGDESIILSSGMDVNKKKSPVGQLPKPENLTVKPGDNKGAVILTCDVVPSASFYEFEYTEMPLTATPNWIQKTCTKRRLQLEGLISGKQYAFRVAGAGSDPSRIYSEIATSYIL